MRGVIMAGVLWLGLAGCNGTGGGTDLGDVPEDGSSPGPATQEALYDEAEIPVLDLRFSAGAWRDFLAGWSRKDRVEVTCDVGFRGVWFEGASCQPKGNEGDWDDETRPQFRITINASRKDARFLGLRRLNLESNREHPAPVRDRLAMGMMRQAGLRAPRVNHVRVMLNGAYYGLFQNIEYVNQEFVAANYPGGGNLYEKGTELRTNEDENDTSDLAALDALVDAEPPDGDHAAFFTALEALVDVPQVIRVMAAETVLPSYDNFSNGSWNYWWYHPPGGRFVLVPWDLDDCLSDLAPPDSDPFTFLGHATKPNRLRQWIDRNPTWRQAFVDELAAIRDGAYAALAGRAAEVCSQIREAFREDPTKNATLEAFDADCADIARRVEARRAFLAAGL